MLICAKCRKEMNCKKNSVGAVFSKTWVYAGDLFECLTCGATILSTNSNGYHSPELNIHSQYIIMDERQYDTHTRRDLLI